MRAKKIAAGAAFFMAGADINDQQGVPIMVISGWGDATGARNFMEWKNYRRW
ncbi:hypothetical protein NJH78_18335 [Pseudomonas chlororaphis]|uniref:hypothetical protein n=1 Tax=Pseudomonas chlororaphis TaxID=587753 RepID=UPI00209ADFC9|nr:hypothetical protein [Pseudomonas chlororaphis]MCO7571945.1 hypothetical protein [Pseudomonas chlororaphis]MCO7589725.1 hypothetical protein [Pseudomonas chlororaphis]